jgi:drug/metabolite transporter (DMT)-like permease
MVKWLSLGLVVAALSCYHLAQRSTPHGGSPAPLFGFVYGVATIVMLVTVAVTGAGEGMQQVKMYASHWAPWLLVLGVTGIELGFYAMYRAGWNISTASISTQSIVAVILVIMGLVAFGEHLTLARGVGVIMCIGGAALVAGR